MRNLVCPSIACKAHRLSHLIQLLRYLQIQRKQFKHQLYTQQYEKLQADLKAALWLHAQSTCHETWRQNETIYELSIVEEMKWLRPECNISRSCSIFVENCHSIWSNINLCLGYLWRETLWTPLHLSRRHSLLNSRGLGNASQRGAYKGLHVWAQSTMIKKNCSLHMWTFICGQQIWSCPILFCHGISFPANIIAWPTATIWDPKGGVICFWDCTSQ